MFITKILFFLKTLQFFWGVLLLLPFLPQITFAQTNWTVLFQDDFEDGNADEWLLGPGWRIETDKENYVLNCDSIVLGDGNPSSAYPLIDFWGSYRELQFEIQMKCISLFYASIGFQSSKYNYNLSFYKVDNQTQIQIVKRNNSENFILARLITDFELNRWFSLKVNFTVSNIAIYMDNVLLMEAADINTALIGNFSLNCENSHVHFDSINIIADKISQQAEWVKTGGPHGGLGYDVRIDPTNPNIIYITDTFAGVCKSTDGGKNWREINNGISVRAGASKDKIPIFCLTIDSSNPDILWAGTQRLKGLFKSMDGGEHWEIKTEGITTEGYSEKAVLTFRDFAVDPHNSDIVFVSGEIENNFDGRTKSVGIVYKSINGGDHWKKVLEADNLFRPIDIDPSNSNIVYATTGIFDRNSPSVEGAFKSTDGGETWFKINDGLDEQWLGGSLVLGFLEMDPQDNNVLYAAVGREPGFGGKAAGGIYKTTNGGNNWTAVLPWDFAFTAVTIAPSDNNIVYAGKDMQIFKSTDSGNSWVNLGFNCPGYFLGIPIGMAVDPYDPEVVYVNNYNGGVFKSTDGGESWFPASRGYSGESVYDVAVVNGNPSFIYVMGRCGLSKSKNGGHDYIGISIREFEVGRCVAYHPNNPQILYAGNSWGGSIYKSEDEGQSWIELCDFVEIDPDTLSDSPELPTQVTSYRMQAIEISKSNPNIIYAGIINDWLAGDIYANSEIVSGYGIFKSIDEGTNWVQINEGIPNGYRQIYDLSIHPSNPDIVYAAVRNSGIYKTIDGGNIWQPKNNGLVSLYISTIAIDPNNPETIYAGTINGSGILKSTNGGETWNPTSEGMTLVCPSNLLPIGGSIKGVSLEKPKVFNFYGNYAEWPWSTVSDIVVDLTNSQIVYASDLMFGVYRSNDGGTNWIQINDGLSMREVSSLAISDDGKILYAGTNGGGVFRLVFGENQAPLIISTIPNASDTVSISQGDSLIFEVMACDLNGDTLSYAWSLDSQFLEGEIGSRYLLKTIGLVLGDHLLNVEVADRDTSVSVSWDIKFITPTAIDNKELANIPNSFALRQNYPNPFNPETTIKYELPKSAQIVVKIHNLLGQEINTLVNEHKKAGYFTINWDGKNSNGHCVSSGIYLYRIDAVSEKQHFIQTKKMILLQ